MYYTYSNVTAKWAWNYQHSPKLAFFSCYHTTFLCYHITFSQCYHLASRATCTILPSAAPCCLTHPTPPSTPCGLLQHHATFCNTMLPPATPCCLLQQHATYCNTMLTPTTPYCLLQHLTASCNTVLPPTEQPTLAAGYTKSRLYQQKQLRWWRRRRQHRA